MRLLVSLKLIGGIALFGMVGVIATLSVVARPSSPTLAVAIEAPATIIAGEVPTIEVLSEVTGQDALIDVHITGAHGLTTLATRVDDGRSIVQLPTEITATSGVLTLAVAASDGLLAHDIEILPAEAAHVRLLVSGETLRVQDAAVVTAYVTDAMGNPVADDTPTQLRVADTTAPSQALVGQTVGGITTFSVPVASGARTLTVVGTSGSAISVAHRIERLAGDPAGIELRRERSDQELVADGRTFTTFSADTIVDADGAMLPSGTVVTLILDGPDGPGLATGRIEGGELRASILAPQRPGTLSITPTLGSYSGQTLQLDYRAAVLPFEASLEPAPIDGGGQRTLVIGPVLGWHGGLVIDGTIVTVNGAQHELINGVAIVQLSSTTDLAIEVLGQQGILR